MIIYGYRSRNKVLGQVPYVCPQCKRNGYHSVVRTSRFFTLFWIPIIPVGSNTTARCNLCGFQEKVDNKRADAMLAQAQSAGQPQGQLQAPAPQYPQQPQAGYPSQYPGAPQYQAMQPPAQYPPNPQYPQQPPQQGSGQNQQGWR